MQRFHLTPSLMIAATLLFGSVALADDDSPALFRLTGAPPLGFEALAQTQVALVDVYYGNRLLLSTMATYTIETLTFSQPDQVLAAIPDLTNPTSIRSILSTPLKANAALLCRGPASVDCGILRPEIAGVIFNADSYRVDLFVAGARR